jgi:hypothetical protein
MLDCRKKKDDEVENKYLFQINNRWTIDGSVRKNTARYINHACRPNAESDVNSRKRTVHIRAIKNIAPGEEINYDYGTEYFKEYLKPIGCKCAACEKKRAKLRAEARAEKAKEKLKAQKKAAKAKPVKSKAVKSKTTKAKSVKASKATRASSRRTAEYARSASSGARPGPQIDSGARASRAGSLKGSAHA